MNHVKHWGAVGLVAAIAVACGAADEEAEVMEGGAAAYEAPAAGAESQPAPGANGALTPASAARELARVDFEDGSQVRFERLGDGLLISEIGPSTNAKHYVPAEGETPAEAFRRLAPRNELPRALFETDRELYPFGAKTVAGAVQIEKAAPGSTPAETQEGSGADVPHTGQFQQSGGLYPYSQFSQNLCNFPIDSPSDFKHGNSTGGHSHIVAKANKAYVAAAADIGDFTIKFCVDTDTNCNAPYQVNPGQSAVLNYDACVSCSKKCEWWNVACKLLGDVQICTPKYRRMTTTTSGLSSGERHHDCGSFTEP